jgi:uncharacterized metal-binding protein
MPSGKIHARSSVILAIPACFIPLGATGDWKTGVAGGLGCLAGIALTPDLDQEGLSTSEHWLIKYTLGLGFLWTMLWYPYARVLKHRSLWSHFPLLGTAGRLLYLAGIAAIVFWGGQKYSGWQLPQRVEPWWSWAVAGLLLSDVAHWLMDTRFGDRPRRRR